MHRQTNRVVPGVAAGRTRNSICVICVICGLFLAQSVEPQETKPFADRARAVAVHRVVVLSVVSSRSSVGDRASLQAAGNYLEVKLVSGLRSSGFLVISLADTKAFTAANWDSIYFNTAREKARDPDPSGASRGRAVSSDHTSVLSDAFAHQKPPDQLRTYSDTFCRTAGEVARRLGAEAAVLAETQAGADRQQSLRLSVIALDGEYVFADRVEVPTKQGVSQGVEEAIRKALDHYPKP
jgi:hypothetical protein